VTEPVPAVNFWLLALRYTSLRVSLFALPLIVLLFSPLPKIVDIAIALVISSIAALFFGRGLRDRMVAAWMDRRPTPIR
jgi:hypothetical protein